MKNVNQEIRDFLNQPENVARLVKASEAGKPAVAGIAEQLLKKFPEHVFTDTVKKRIGFMVLKILEPRGWVSDQKGVKVYLKPFTVATRYRRHE